MGYIPPSSALKFDSNGNVLANLNAQNITPSVTASNIKLDSNGNVLANLNAQNITPNVSATNIKLDSNGYVEANIFAQNITPTVTASNIKFDSNGNVLANLNAQNINPTIANPYLPTMLSHQTGLSITASTANTLYVIGSAISVTRSGIALISMMGHVSAGEGFITFNLKRGSNTFTYGYTSGNPPNSIFGNVGYPSSSNYISNTTSLPLFTTGNFSTLSNNESGASPSFILPVYSGDSLQFYATNSTAGEVTYIDDVLVMLI
ncbi:MAG: hypothetical protein QXV17_14180 [Candidatus Micrarchaeaceae archaeon]